MEESKAKRFLKFGCLGCLGLLILVAGAIGVVALVARNSAQSYKPESKALSVPVEAPVQPEPGSGKPAEPETATPTRVALDLAQAEFQIEPGAPGEPLRMDATFDPACFEMFEELDESTQPPTRRVRFRRHGSWLWSTLRRAFGVPAPQLQVYLPRDVPLELEMQLAEGGGKVELGGLWLVEADIQLSKGGLEVGFDEPTRAPLERLRISASMGGVAASGLGNASPRRLELGMSMGGGAFDLRGAWAQDAEISVESRMGGADVRLPPDVTVVGLEDRGIDTGAAPELPRPTLRFRVEHDGRGDLQFRK